MGQSQDWEKMGIAGVESINNLDTARMTLRWALERLRTIEEKNNAFEKKIKEFGDIKEKLGEERSALKRGADIIIMIHPDYQYDARLAPIMISLIKNGICDIVLGNRIRTRWEALSGGMPLYKYLSNRFLTILENTCTGQNLGEWHSGLRAYSRKSLEAVRWENNSDDFVFDQELLLHAAACHLKTGDIPVAARYFPEASSINFKRSVVYGLSTLKILAQYVPHRLGLVHFDWLSPRPQNQETIFRP